MVAVYALINACVVQCDGMRQVSRRLIMDTECVCIHKPHSEIHTLHQDGWHTEGFHPGRVDPCDPSVVDQGSPNVPLATWNQAAALLETEGGRMGPKGGRRRRVGSQHFVSNGPRFCRCAEPVTRTLSAAFDTSQEETTVWLFLSPHFVASVPLLTQPSDGQAGESLAGTN